MKLKVQRFGGTLPLFYFIFIKIKKSMKLAPSAAIAASVGLRHVMNQWGQARYESVGRLAGFT
jgi:hypothetical protein